ncbi:MAG: type II toxin-antitoxin system PemK/MazF family toxin [Pseudonocardiaceae bacterium]
MLNSGDVVQLDLGLPSGREVSFWYSVVVVTAQRILDAGPSVVHGVPLTSRIRRFGSEVRIDPNTSNGLDRPSAAQCQHLRAVSTGRIEKVCGNVGAQALTQVREMISVILDLIR